MVIILLEPPSWNGFQFTPLLCLLPVHCLLPVSCPSLPRYQLPVNLPELAIMLFRLLQFVHFLLNLLLEILQALLCCYKRFVESTKGGEELHIGFAGGRSDLSVSENRV